ncbi:MAG: mannose-6-phosphate isomerase, class I [Candidatus Cloacimonetes bacterium HGW-Cloacimonetes-2]|jgi:mannose-6-phosphate isomerase|nr:MAG: mannose-6-phosphate isomerase, class I [Candidatus Cloacimonetes bacterium HGW-Cloacimonetes-2]
MISKLINPIQHYSWGSRSFLQELTRDPSLAGKPAAELWMGAHPQAPSKITFNGTQMPLGDFLDTNPSSLLGKSDSPRLPYLFKVLAVEQALSIQVHPSRRQAREGFALEQARGISLSDPMRKYRDDNHKPELIYALTEFKALCGFRRYSQIISLGKILGFDQLLSFRTFSAQPDTARFRQLICELLSLRNYELQAFLQACLARLDQLPEADTAELIRELHELYPFDIGAIFPALVNLIKLNPGEAIYLDAGIIHCYLKGAGLEVMASSDNVLRAGLSPKYIDVAEFCKICSFEPYYPLIICSNPQPGEFGTYASPCPDFRLRKINLPADHELVLDPENSPLIIYCMDGRATIAGNLLIRGESLFVSADEAQLKLSGRATLFVVDLP